MGDLGSSKSQSNSTSVANQQVTQQVREGGAALGISGSTLGSGNTINVVSSDREIALAAIKAVSEGSDVSAAVALESNKTGQLALSVSNRGLDIADDAVTQSFSTVTNVLDFLKENQAQSNAVVDRAVSTAEEIALRAAPVSPGSYGEIIAGQQSDTSKQIIYVGAALAAITVLAFAYKK